ncbi:MAG: ribose 5-phosphate isomerase B, partial [Kiritimatiellae bacterium]|nr:ribose 5-phosphate isomerase B [Kiritimatiellia bacterium]
MNIAIGSDHGGVELKAALVGALAGAAKMIDMGPADKTSCDYPDYAQKVALDVSSGAADYGILVCRSGVGMSMCANRFQNVRAALCTTTDAATMTRQHNGANVLCLGADVVSSDYAVEIAKTFLATPVDMDARHERRRMKLERAG